jgi:hypothetical protein
MAITLTDIGSMVGTDIKNLRLTKIDESISDLKYIRNDIETDQNIKGNLTISGILGHQYQNIVDIDSNSKLDIDLNSIGINGLFSIYDIKILDENSDSDTYDTYINSETVSIVSISNDGTSCSIINYDDITHKFLINIKDI